VARSTKQRPNTSAAPSNATTSRPSRNAQARASSGGMIRSSNGRVPRQHDAEPGQGHPIFDELIAELGDPRRSA